MSSHRPQPCLSDQDGQPYGAKVGDPSAAELAWRVAYSEWMATPDGPAEHDARMRLKEARQALTWDERVGLWERYLAVLDDRTAEGGTDPLVTSRENG